jgi:hypothetical protein
MFDTLMKRISILALLSALALPALGDDLKITVNPHFETEVAMAAAEGFSSVEEWYAHLNKDVFLPDEINRLKKIWASLGPELQRSLHDAEAKWEQWYNSLPSKTAQNIARRLGAVQQHNRDLEAWLPQNLRSGPPEYAPGTSRDSTEPVPTRPPTLQEMGTPTRPPTTQESGTPKRPPTAQEMGNPNFRP